MTARRSSQLDRQLEAWARWVFGGGQTTGGKSLLARWMEGRGHLVFGGGPADSSDTLESLIEAAVFAMAQDNLLRADILRLEYGAGAYDVIARRGVRGYDCRSMTQTKHALALGISVRTYRSRLAEAKKLVKDALSSRSPYA